MLVTVISSVDLLISEFEKTIAFQGYFPEDSDFFVNYSEFSKPFLHSPGFSETFENCYVFCFIF